MEKKKEYNISINKGSLIFTTTSFNAEEGSVLHTGIYSRELTSSLASGALLVGIAVMLVLMGIKVSIPLMAAGAVLFFVLMVLFRMYVFFEAVFRVEIDKSMGVINFFKKGFKSQRETVPLEKLRSIRWGVTLIVPENTDGIGVVKQISAQHGMPIPGFGETRELHSVVFEFKDERDIMVFSSEDQDEVDVVMDMMKNFVGGEVAQAD